MANSIILTQDCLIRVAFLPDREFTVGEIIQPSSRYFQILIRSNYATDSGIPALPDEDYIAPFEAVVLQRPQIDGVSVRWNLDLGIWEIFDINAAVADSPQFGKIAASGARVRNLGGYKAPSSLCPPTKAEVSVTNNYFDGYDYIGPGYKIQEVLDFAECNWVDEQLALVDGVFWYTIASGPWNEGTTTPNGITKPMDFTTMLEGNYFSVGYSFIGGVWSPDVRVWIDDEEISEWYLGDRATGVLQTTGAINAGSLGTGIHILNINFAERGTYKIRIAGPINTLGGASAGAPTVGNLITVNNGVRLLKPAPRPQVGIISDSFFEPIIGQTCLTIALEMSHHLNVNLHNCAQGGSGFVNPSAGIGDKSYRGDLVWDAIKRLPPLDMLVINGSANDLGYTEAQVETVMLTTFNRARAYRSDIPIVWIGIQPQSYFKGIYGLPAIKAREAFQMEIALADPNVILAIPSGEEEWLTGTGYDGGVTYDGNQDYVIGSDHVHLSSYGTKYYGKMIAERMKSAIMLLQGE